MWMKVRSCTMSINSTMSCLSSMAHCEPRLVDDRIVGGMTGEPLLLIADRRALDSNAKCSLILYGRHAMPQSGAGGRCDGPRSGRDLNVTDTRCILRNALGIETPAGSPVSSYL